MEENTMRYPKNQKTLQTRLCKILPIIIIVSFLSGCDLSKQQLDLSSYQSETSSYSMEPETYLSDFPAFESLNIGTFEAQNHTSRLSLSSYDSICFEVTEPTPVSVIIKTCEFTSQDMALDDIGLSLGDVIIDSYTHNRSLTFESVKKINAQIGITVESELVCKPERKLKNGLHWYKDNGDYHYYVYPLDSHYGIKIGVESKNEDISTIEKKLEENISFQKNNAAAAKIDDALIDMYTSKHIYVNSDMIISNYFPDEMILSYDDEPLYVIYEPLFDVEYEQFYKGSGIYKLDNRRTHIGAVYQKGNAFFDVFFNGKGLCRIKYVGDEDCNTIVNNLLRDLLL